MNKITIIVAVRCGIRCGLVVDQVGLLMDIIEAIAS